MLGFLLRRVGFAALTLVLTAFFAFGIIRLLRPELYGGQNLFTGTWMDSKEALLHLTIDGDASIKEEWRDGLWADLFLLAGGAAVAVVMGVTAGLWCAARPRTRASRGVESTAMFLLCAPPYVLALGTLLLFAPPFGLVQLPYFFDPHSYAPPLQNPWDFVRSMVVPWLLVGAPLSASMMRLTLALTIEGMGEEWVRTAQAKGVPYKRVVRRHAAPSAFATVASLFGASAPILVLNIVLVAFGFKKTLGHVEDPLKLVPAAALMGGAALYLLAHVAFRWRNIHTLNRQRLVVAIALVPLIAVAVAIPALAALAMLAAILCALVAYEAIRFGEARERLRRRLLHEA